MTQFIWKLFKSPSARTAATAQVTVATVRFFPLEWARRRSKPVCGASAGGRKVADVVAEQQCTVRLSGGD